MSVRTHLSPQQFTGGYASGKLHFGQSHVPVHGVHVLPRMHPVCGGVAEEETQGKEEPTAKRLRGSRKTPQCGKIPQYILIFTKI